MQHKSGTDWRNAWIQEEKQQHRVAHKQWLTTVSSLEDQEPTERNNSSHVADYKMKSLLSGFAELMSNDSVQSDAQIRKVDPLVLIVPFLNLTLQYMSAIIFTHF